MWFLGCYLIGDSVVIRINLSTAVRRGIVMLSATKHLGPANEVLSEAKDDTVAFRMTRQEVAFFGCCMLMPIMWINNKGMSPISKIAKILAFLPYIAGIGFVLFSIYKFKQHKCGAYPVCECFPLFPPCQWEWVRRNRLTHQFLF